MPGNDGGGHRFHGVDRCEAAAMRCRSWTIGNRQSRWPISRWSGFGGAARWRPLIRIGDCNWGTHDQEVLWPPADPAQRGAAAGHGPGADRCDVVAVIQVRIVDQASLQATGGGAASRSKRASTTSSCCDGALVSAIAPRNSRQRLSHGPSRGRRSPASRWDRGHAGSP